GRRHGHAVISLLAANDLLFPRPPERVVHVPDELDLGIIRLRARGAEEHFRRRHRRDLLEPFGKLDRGIMALRGEEMAEGKLPHMRGSVSSQLLFAVAQRSAPQARHAFDIGLTLGIVDEYPLAALDDERTRFAQCREIGVGVNQGLEVANGKIAERGHVLASGLQRYRRSRRLASKNLPRRANSRGSRAKASSVAHAKRWRAARPAPTRFYGAAAGRGGGNGTCAASSPGSRTSHWHMR